MLISRFKKFHNKKIKRALLVTLCFAMVISSVAFVKTSNMDNQEAVSVLSKLGSRGDEVRKVQTKLKSLGLYTGTVDGIYGVNTQRAVRQFQRNCGISADGIAGPKTLLYLGITSSNGSYSNSDLNLLARVISAEARGENYTGQVAVGAVILNRIEHPSFPNTLAGVIYQPGAFTCVNDSNWNKNVLASAYKAAQDCMNGWDPSGGAIYYYNPSKTTNKWMLSRPVITTIGSHVFCK